MINVWEFAVPTSENDPRVPVILATHPGEFELNVFAGLAKLGCLKGKLFASRRNWKRIRSRKVHDFDREAG